jgi:hypothetical protein
LKPSETKEIDALQSAEAFETPEKHSRKERAQVVFLPPPLSRREKKKTKNKTRLNFFCLSLVVNALSLLVNALSLHHDGSRLHLRLFELLVRQHHGAVQDDLVLDVAVLSDHRLVAHARPLAHGGAPADDRVRDARVRVELDALEEDRVADAGACF